MDRRDGSFGGVNSLRGAAGERSVGGGAGELCWWWCRLVMVVVMVTVSI